MRGESFANFFITFQPVLDEVQMRRAQNKVKKMHDNLMKQFKKDWKKTTDNISQSSDKIVDKVKQGSKEVNDDVKKTSVIVSKNLSSTFKAFTRISKMAVLMSSVLGGLALLQNSQIYELDNNLKSIKDNSEEVYKYMSASNKVMGASKEGVADELNQLVKSRQKKIATGEDDRPELALFGASVDDNMDTILQKFRQKIRSMSDVEGKIFAEKTGLSNIYEIAKLDDEKFNQLTQSFLYQKDNIEKMKKAGEATKELLASLGEVKDEMVVSFSPIVIGILKTISSFLKSALIDKIVQAVSGLAEDIVKFNNALAGVPFAILIGLLASIAVSISPIGVAILTLITVIQDILRAISGTKIGQRFGMKDRSESSLIGSGITNKISWLRRDDSKETVLPQQEKDNKTIQNKEKEIKQDKKTKKPQGKQESNLISPEKNKEKEIKQDKNESRLTSSNVRDKDKIIRDKINWFSEDKKKEIPRDGVNNTKDIIGIANTTKKPTDFDYKFLQKMTNSTTSNIVNNNQNFKQNNNVNVSVNVASTNAKPEEIGKVVANKINQVIIDKDRRNNIMSPY